MADQNPFDEDAFKEQEEQREHKAYELRIAFGQTFGSEAGKVVLKALQDQFGWRDGIEQPSWRPGMDFQNTTFNEGTKEVVRHIMAMLLPVKRKVKTNEHRSDSYTSPSGGTGKQYIGGTTGEAS